VRLVAVYLALTGAVTFASAGASAPNAPSCRTSQLKIALTHTGAVTGVEGGYLRFTNRSDASCRISGWPTVIAVEPTGRTVEAHRALHGMMFGGWTSRSPLPVMTLKPGDSVYAAVEDGDNPVQSPRKPCPTARWLRVSPPGDSQRTRLSAWLRNDGAFLPLCTAYSGSPELAVSAVVPLSALAR
jgi:hypothetical protein